MLGRTAKEVAELLECTVAAANSALQRARATLSRELPSGTRETAAASAADDDQTLLDAYMAASSGLTWTPSQIS